MKLWNAYKKFITSSLGLMSMGLVLSSATILGWKWGISPILKRRKRKQAEEFADFIFEERNKKLMDNVHQ